MNLSVRAISSSEAREVVTHLLNLAGQDAGQIEDEIRFINWWFYGRDTDKAVFAAAFVDENEPAGFVGYAQTELRSEGNIVHAGIMSSAMTHPKFRGMGVFSSLMGYLIESAARDGLDILYGSPGHKSYPIFIKKLGFTPLFHWHRSARPQRWGRIGARFGTPGKMVTRVAGRIYDAAIPLRIEGFRFTTEKELPDDFDSFIDRAVRQANCHLVRTPEYCRWRFSRPGREYRHVILRNHDNLIAGWAMLSKLEHGNKSRFHIGDYWITGENPRTIRALMAATSQEAAHHSVDEIYIAGRTCSRVHDLRRLGFIRWKSQTPIVVISPTGRDLSIVDGWEFRDTDVDMF